MIADSSTEAIPSITVPSPGIPSPASTTTTSPRTSSAADFSVPSRIFAVASVRIARRLAAWARPRPSASASARLAKTTVSHSQIVIEKVNQAGSWPPPRLSPPKTWISQATVVITAPISTTNMTGLRTWTRGSSLVTDSQQRGAQDLAVEERNGALDEVGCWSVGGSSSFQRCFLVEGDVEFEHVHAGLAEHSERAAVGVLRRSVLRPSPSGRWRTAAIRWAWIAALASEMSGSTPEADWVTASTGTSSRVSEWS